MDTISDQRQTRRSLAAVWAKTGPGERHLPLVHHMLDVAAVAGAMWDLVLTEPARARVARGLGLDPEEARAWVVWLAALHDVGKCSPAFQQKASERQADLVAAGLVAPQLGTGGDVPHGTISAHLIATELRQRGAARGVAEALAVAIGGHHGSFPRSDDVRRGTARRQLGDGPWNAVRETLFAAIERELPVPDMPPARCEPGALVTLAGLVSVADWIGSDSYRFPLFAPGAPPPTPAARRQQAQAIARERLEALRWTGRAIDEATLAAPTLEHVVGRPPRAAQEATAALLAPTRGPSLVLLETETGSGKSEAALWAVVHGLAHGACGTYFALPTQATANQMHRRMRAALARVLGADPDAVGLLHGAAELVVDEEVLDGQRPAVEPHDVHDDTSDADARAWFAVRKRGLLTRFAIGTVDQALLGVLATRHFFVRLWGVADAVVVLDEVHSYDAYTSDIVMRLVEWCAACGSTVVLLSATLAARDRRRLTDAYAAGAGWSQPSPPPPRPSYPRVTVLSGDGERSVGVATVRTEDRSTIALDWSDAAEDPRRLAAEVLEATASGGCVAIVCNTVVLAQQRFEELRSLASHDITLELFHARMRHCERASVERRLAERFGPPGTGGERPRRAIVVATQVVEQSLDVDFDALWTDLAPIDLLVQRAGRVMRHVRPELDGRGLRSGRRLTVLVPDHSDPTVLLRNRVYEPAILLRTRAVLRDRAAIAEPDDLDELVDDVYDDAVPPSDPALREAIEQADPDREERERRKRALAGYAMLSPPTDPLLLRELRGDVRPDRDDLQLGTRYSELPSIGAIVLRHGELPELLGRPPGIDAARELLRRSMRLPFDGRRANYPPEWQRSTFLRDYVLVQLDRSDRAEVCGRSIAWDETLGVQIAKGDRE